MTLRLDHVVILVHDLDAAQARYREAGFTLVYGGQHTGGYTHNALIVFQDGSYLELLAPTDPTLLKDDAHKQPGSFLSWFAEGEGFGGFALHASDLVAEAKRIQEQRIRLSVSTGGRKRADGQELQWRSGFLDDRSLLPFFIEDVTPRKLRVSDETAHTSHANGAAGIQRITLGSSLFDSDGHTYNLLLGQQGRLLANRIEYPLDSSRIVLQPAVKTGRHIQQVVLSGMTEQVLHDITPGVKLSIIPV